MVQQMATIIIMVIKAITTTMIRRRDSQGSRDTGLRVISAAGTILAHRIILMHKITRKQENPGKGKRLPRQKRKLQGRL